MAKQIEGVSERILSCAKAEFLDKGYTDASLRVIAAAAETSTNSIYVRFGDKEGLFSAIVEPVLSEMTERFIKIQERFRHMTQAEQEAHMAEYADGGTVELVDYDDALDTAEAAMTISTSSGCCWMRPMAQGSTILSMNWCASRWNIPINIWRRSAALRIWETRRRRSFCTSSRPHALRAFLKSFVTR